jgi:DinB superfamily
VNATQFVHQQIAEARSLSDAAMAGVTDEQFNWLPSGTINPIKSVFLHAVAGEDLFFQSIIQGRPPLWATGGWAGKIGLAQAPGGGQGWEEARNAVLALAPALAYADAVCNATNEYLARLTDDELDREVSFFGTDSSVAGVLARFVAHTASHAGEIAAVKGVQGVQGLPF